MKKMLKSQYKNIKKVKREEEDYYAGTGFYETREKLIETLDRLNIPHHFEENNPEIIVIENADEEEAFIRICGEDENHYDSISLDMIGSNVNNHEWDNDFYIVYIDKIESQNEMEEYLPIYAKGRAAFDEYVREKHYKVWLSESINLEGYREKYLKFIERRNFARRYFGTPIYRELYYKKFNTWASGCELGPDAWQERIDRIERAYDKAIEELYNAVDTILDDEDIPF